MGASSPTRWVCTCFQTNSHYIHHLSGLGKTCQVISFLAHLKEKGNTGPHLIIVPSSTLENWCREFDRFAPSIKWVTYYDDQKTREKLRMDLRDDDGSPYGWEVLITTYDLACGNSKDSKFLRKFDWELSNLSPSIWIARLTIV